MRVQIQQPGLYYDIVLSLAIQTMQSEDAAVAWMHTRHGCLRNQRPVDMLNTMEGVRMLRWVLNAAYG